MLSLHTSFLQALTDERERSEKDRKNHGRGRMRERSKREWQKRAKKIHVTEYLFVFLPALEIQRFTILINIGCWQHSFNHLSHCLWFWWKRVMLVFIMPSVRDGGVALLSSTAIRHLLAMNSSDVVRSCASRSAWPKHQCGCCGSHNACTYHIYWTCPTSSTHELPWWECAQRRWLCSCSPTLQLWRWKLASGTLSCAVSASIVLKCIMQAKQVSNNEMMCSVVTGVCMCDCQHLQTRNVETIVL